MPSKLSVHLGSYPKGTFDVLERMQPSLVLIFNQSSEMNIDLIRARCPKTVVVYRHYSDHNYREPADLFFGDMRDTLNKLKGRGILWEGINEPVVQTEDDAQALNTWTVRFAQLLHAEGELCAGFVWSTGNPTPNRLSQFIPLLVDAAAAADVHAFHEYYRNNGGQGDWGRYRDFERALPASARKPVIITEAGWDDSGDPQTGGYRGKISNQQYLDILKAYDALLMQDLSVLGAAVFQWGDGRWTSFDLTPMIDLLATYVKQSGGGLIAPKPWPLPCFDPSFGVTPQNITIGQSATLQWNVDSARDISLDGQPVDAHNSKTVTPAQTTTYTLKMTLADNTTKSLTTTLSVNPLGSPKISEATFSPASLHPGDLLNVKITVTNDTPNTFSTQGPDPGFVYEEGETFRSRGFPDVKDAFRVGVACDAPTVVDHPYRWGLGAPLAPGQQVTVTGAIRVKTVRSINYWAGLVRERIAWVQDRQGLQLVAVAGAGQVEITGVSFTPQSLNTDGVLSVSITVKNGTADTLTTQGPDPGFAYEEGDTFRSRGYNETSGSYRVGVDFDGRDATAIDHPYRWGLGSPLAPGQTATVTGRIHLKTVREGKYWAGLVREQVAWLQDRQGEQSITVSPAPTLSFTALPTTIGLGESSRLEWNSTGVTEVTLDGQSVETRGWQIVRPAQSTTYTLHAVLNDGSARDVIVTVAVSSQSQVVRPPTVTLTPENVALLQTYPRPVHDNGRGLHFHIDLSEGTIATVVPLLQSIGCTWTAIYAPDENQAQRAAKGCWDAGIMPMVRIGKRVDEAFDPVRYVTALKNVGAPPYIQIFNEPGDSREWKNWPGQDHWAGIFGGRWAQAAIAIYDAGGYPGLQVQGREEFDAAVQAVAGQGRTDIWQRAFFALHNYAANHPPNYPYDTITNKTIFEDDVSVLAFLEFAAWMKEKIGFVLPMIGEGGWQFGAGDDTRYPRVEAPLHAQYHAGMFDWFRTGVIGNGEALPDYLFSITPWILGGWGADDWWGGPLGDKTETIKAVRALPAFVRQFSWDGGSSPASTCTLTATPNALKIGETTSLEWTVTNATQVKLDGEIVPPAGKRTISPIQTTTYKLQASCTDGTTKETSVTVTVSASEAPTLRWDARLDALGVKLTRATSAHAWQLIEAAYQDEKQSGGNHNIYYKLLKADGSPAAGVRLIMDWKGRPPQDDPAYVTTNAKGEANCPLWAILHPELKDGPYFTKTVTDPSDVVSGMGLPVNRHVNYLLTYRFQ